MCLFLAIPELFWQCTYVDKSTESFSETLNNKYFSKFLKYQNGLKGTSIKNRDDIGICKFSNTLSIAKGYIDTA